MLRVNILGAGTPVPSPTRFGFSQVNDVLMSGSRAAGV